MLAYYPYTPTNYNNVPTLAHTHLMFLISIDSLHLSSINYTNTYILSLTIFDHNDLISLSAIEKSLWELIKRDCLAKEIVLGN